MAYRPKGNNTTKLVGIIVAVVVQAGLVWGLAAGLVQSYVKSVVQDVQTTVLPPKEKPPDEPPPPPPKIDTPPPSVPPPDIQIAPPEGGNPPTHVRQTNSPAPSGTRFPTPRGSSRPEYPATEKAKGHEGKVLLHLCVDGTGTITEASITTSSGYPALDDSAVSWARSIKWTPATVEGQVQQAFCWDQPYRFVLRNG